MQGEGFEPKADPRPVVKVTRLQPLAIWPVTEAGSYPGESMKVKPRAVTGSAYLYTPASGEVPPFAAAPSDFSSIVVSPPFLLPGLGLLSIEPRLRSV